MRCARGELPGLLGDGPSEWTPEPTNSMNLGRRHYSSAEYSLGVSSVVPSRPMRRSIFPNPACNNDLLEPVSLLHNEYKQSRERSSRRSLMPAPVDSVGLLDTIIPGHIDQVSYNDSRLFAGDLEQMVVDRGGSFYDRGVINSCSNVALFSGLLDRRHSFNEIRDDDERRYYDRGRVNNDRDRRQIDRQRYSDSRSGTQLSHRHRRSRSRSRSYRSRDRRSRSSSCERRSRSRRSPSPARDRRSHSRSKRQRSKSRSRDVQRFSRQRSRSRSDESRSRSHSRSRNRRSYSKPRDSRRRNASRSPPSKYRRTEDRRSQSPNQPESQKNQRHELDSRAGTKDLSRPDVKPTLKQTDVKPNAKQELDAEANLSKPDSISGNTPLSAKMEKKRKTSNADAKPVDITRSDGVRVSQSSISNIKSEERAESKTDDVAQAPVESQNAPVVQSVTSGRRKPPTRNDTIFGGHRRMVVAIEELASSNPQPSVSRDKIRTKEQLVVLLDGLTELYGSVADSEGVSTVQHDHDSDTKSSGSAPTSHAADPVSNLILTTASKIWNIRIKKKITSKSGKDLKSTAVSGEGVLETIDYASPLKRADDKTSNGYTERTPKIAPLMQVDISSEVVRKFRDQSLSANRHRPDSSHLLTDGSSDSRERPRRQPSLLAQISNGMSQTLSSLTTKPSNFEIGMAGKQRSAYAMSESSRNGGTSLVNSTALPKHPTVAQQQPVDRIDPKVQVISNADLQQKVPTPPVTTPSTATKATITAPFDPMSFLNVGNNDGKITEPERPVCEPLPSTSVSTKPKQKKSADDAKKQLVEAAKLILNTIGRSEKLLKSEKQNNSEDTADEDPFYDLIEVRGHIQFLLNEPTSILQVDRAKRLQTLELLPLIDALQSVARNNPEAVSNAVLTRVIRFVHELVVLSSEKNGISVAGLSNAKAAHR